jgi:hypothetical protein
MRTPEQTERALFFSDNAVAQYQASMRGIAAERDLEVIAGAAFVAVPSKPFPVTPYTNSRVMNTVGRMGAR